MAKKKQVDEGLMETTGFWIFVVAVIAIVLVISIVFLIRTINSDYNYEGKNGEFTITKSKVGEVIFYSTSVFIDNQEYIYAFRNHPKDLEDIHLEEGLFDKLVNKTGMKTIYVTRDPELAVMTHQDSTLAMDSFKQMLNEKYVNIFDATIINGFTSFASADVPVLTCGNASTKFAVIEMRLGDENKVYSDGKCIIIQGRGGEGLLMAAEKFAYSLINVF